MIEVYSKEKWQTWVKLQEHPRPFPCSLLSDPTTCSTVMKGTIHTKQRGEVLDASKSFGLHAFILF